MTAPSWITSSLRVISMVSELHRMGFQRLRIFPYEYPVAWRVCIAPRAACSARNGAYVLHSAFGLYPDPGGSPLSPTSCAALIIYTSGSDQEYFGWTDARTNSARGLARKFVARFPAAAEAGRGRDWEYAGWLDELMSELKDGLRLPFVMAEYFEPGPMELRGLPIRNFRPGDGPNVSIHFPLPPAGEYSHGD